MAQAWDHARSCVTKWGGRPEDYIDIEHWFDGSKEYMGDFRHRALRHHAVGIAECRRRFGITLINSDGRTVPVQLIAERHVIEDHGFLPTLQDWFRYIAPQPWMNKPKKLFPGE